jgi:hypothetical protein
MALFGHKHRRWHRRQNKRAQDVGTNEGNDPIGRELQQNGFGNIVGLRQQQHWRAGLAVQPWTWHDLLTYPTIF